MKTIIVCLMLLLANSSFAQIYIEDIDEKIEQLVQQNRMLLQKADSLNKQLKIIIASRQEGDATIKARQNEINSLLGIVKVNIDMMYALQDRKRILQQIESNGCNNNK